MSEDRFITVTAPEGVTAPIHPNDGSDPSKPAGLHVTEGVVARVRYSQDVRRAIGRGDLIPCKLDGKPCSLEDAKSSAPLNVGSIVTDEDLFVAKLKTRPPAPKATANTDASNAPTVDMTTEGKR